MKQWKHICLKWNEFIKRILRKESIFKRLNLSFLGLLLGAAAFITFFSFDKYSKEIIWNLKQNAAMQVQNICLKMEDIMREYEDVALQFYDDARVLQAAVENAEADQNGEKGKEDNIALIEEKLYTMSRQRKHIKNVQFVTPGRQYHMMEENGYRRGGTIRNLTEFYNKTYYQEPQEKHGYPVWFEDAGQSETFYENEQSVYGFGSIVTLGVAVYNPYTREFLGVLFININIEAFEAAADGYEGGPEGNMFLTGKDSVVQGFAPSIYAPSFPKDKTIFDDMKEKQKDSVRKRIEERDVLFAYENIPGTDMSVVYLGNMDRLLEESDIISLHVPLNDKTRGMIGAKEIGKMKKTAVLINTARGPIVDSKALAEALKEGRLAGAGVDVFEQEPPVPSDHPLFSAPNTIVTPHAAFATKEAMVKRAVTVFENVDFYLKGTPRNVM